ncbi:MAG: hypothetical protein IH591_14960 [Bacteroidales bacterium]|nr:hypothetical protein [Bacteroidales bacterium]
MKINIPSLLDFYDGYRAENSEHVTAITSFLGVDLMLGILRHYFQGQEAECRITTGEPTAIEGRQRLDRWVVVEQGGHMVWYQTEVKSWSVYTAGVPRTLDKSMNERQINNYAYDMYHRQWNERTGSFTDYENLGKVLQPMNPPEGYSEGSSEIRPLVCYWYPITSSGRTRLTNHFFTLATRSSSFSEVDIFSASLYLRHLAAMGTTQIDIYTGPLTTTLKLMNSFIISH